MKRGLHKELMMKKLLIVGAVVLVTLVALGVAGLAYAQSQNPPTPAPEGNTQYTPGMMGGWRGMMGWRQGYRQGMMNGYRRGFAQGAYGPMHDYMIAALAGKLGLTVDELNAKIANGERPYDIALSKGLTEDQVRELMEQAHDEALQAAVAAGVLTQEQVDRMDQMMGQMWQNGGGFGRMGAGGFGNGRFGSGGCPGMDGSTAPQP
jgi:hypothetical protein